MPDSPSAQRLRFDGWIAGLGSTSGTRIVLGHWPSSPFGPISDLMIEEPGGRRLLIAPSGTVADFIAATYAFDDVEVWPVSVTTGPDSWSVRAGELELEFGVGPRPPLGRMLRLIPPGMATRPWFVAALDLPARVLLPGVRTRGTAGNGRREWYGARDLWTVSTLRGTFGEADLGELAAVTPPVRFGFGSVPIRPGLVRITTVVEVAQL